MGAARRSLTLAALAVAAAVPASAHGAAVEVSGPTLKVNIGDSSGGSGGTGAQVHRLPDGGALVGLHGSLTPADRTVGTGCQVVSPSEAPSMPGGYPVSAGGPTVAASCTLEGVRVVEGNLRASNTAQAWLSSINLPTNIQMGANASGAVARDRITTGDGGDRIAGSNAPEQIDPGGAPYRAQEALPPSGNPATDDPLQNSVNGGGGDDTILLSRGSGRDMVTGGAGTDVVSYADRFGIGQPGAVGVHVSLDGQANDGDPNLQPADRPTRGEGDNVGTDVENVNGTKREDRLIGNGFPNVLFGDQGVDTLTGGSSEDTIVAREPAVAGAGIPDTISCGSPAPLQTTSTTFGVLSVQSGVDKLEKDLADVKPADCELLVDMAVNEPAPVDIAPTARRPRGNRLAVKLACPRRARRTCRGRLRLAGRRSGSRPARFAIRGGAKRTLRLRLSRPAARALRRRGVSARLVSNEKGLRGEVNRIAIVRVGG